MLSLQYPARVQLRLHWSFPHGTYTATSNCRQTSYQLKQCSKTGQHVLDGEGESCPSLLYTARWPRSVEVEHTLRRAFSSHRSSADVCQFHCHGEYLRLIYKHSHQGRWRIAPMARPRLWLSSELHLMTPTACKQIHPSLVHRSSSVCSFMSRNNCLDSVIVHYY